MPAAEPLAQQSSRVYADYWPFTINLGSNMQDPPLDPDLAPGADIIATHNHSAVVRTSFRSGSVDIDLQSWQHDPGPIDTQYDAVATAVIASDRSSIWVEGFMSSSGAVRMIFRRPSTTPSGCIRSTGSWTATWIQPRVHRTRWTHRATRSSAT